METLVLQTILLLLAAYFIGYFAGYFIKYAFAGKGGGGKPAKRDVAANKAASGSQPTAEKKSAPIEQPPATKEPVAAKKPAPAKKAAKSELADDLTRIKGIGPAISKKLHDLDIHRFEQIAGWDETDIDTINQQLRFKGRIQREKWIEQAKDLAGKD